MAVNIGNSTNMAIRYYFKLPCKLRGTTSYWNLLSGMRLLGLRPSTAESRCLEVWCRYSRILKLLGFGFQTLRV